MTDIANPVMSEQAAQLSTASDLLQHSLDRLAHLSDVRLLVSEVLTSTIAVAGAAGGALLGYDAATHTLVLQSYVLDGLVLDITNNERLARKQEVMSAADFPHWGDIVGATDTFFSYDGCGVHPALPEVVYTDTPMNSTGLALRRGDTVLGLLILVYRPSDEVPAERILATRTLTRYAALVLELAWLADESSTKLGPAWASAREPLETVRQLAVEGLAEARRSVSMLRPPVTPHGLAQAVQDAADLVRGYYRGALDVRVSGVAHVVERSAEEELFAIVREALTNATKHSKASRIEVEVAFPDERSVRVAVTDDGVGFDPDQSRNGRFGLVGMSERADRIGAALTLASEPGGGTEIVAVWPNA